MSFFDNRLKLLLIVSVVFVSACATQQPYDYTALQESKPRSIVIIPPSNNTVEVNAPYIFLSTISRPLAEKGYYVFPVSVIDQFLKENGLQTPAEMNTIPLKKIAQHIGADAVLYVTIDSWGQKYQILASTTIVTSKLKLVDIKTGMTLWEATAHAEKSSDSGSGSLAGALIAALVTQIAGSVMDQTPQVSRLANNLAINNGKRGLLNGPYAPLKLKE